VVSSVAAVSLLPLEAPLSHYKTQPPWEFLLSASRNSLQSYELSRLSHAANLRKEIAQLLDSWLEENSAAMLARWLMEHPKRLAASEMESPADTCAENGHVVSDNVFADCAGSPPVHRPR
jgi:hypothetical protein